MHSDELEIAWFTIFPYDKFFERYRKNKITDFDILKEDMIDTYCDYVASVPYTKQEMMDNIYIGVYSDIIKKIEL